MLTQDQSDVVAFLSSPSTYGQTEAVRTMETHISRIFLTGQRVYKLKRAVKLPYVDFSTAEIRAEACAREIAFNRPGAPGLYLGLRRITRGPDGRLVFDGPGPLVDSVVEMQEFAQDCLFDKMAELGRLDERQMIDVADMIADYHRQAPIAADEGGAANIAGILDINEAGFATSHVFAPEAVARLNAAFRHGLVTHAERLDRRQALGHIRRCHGDLHLRNIALIDGSPRLFDCIEFNDRIAICDTLYDLAFLLMDLWHRDMPEFANLVMNRYLDRTGDSHGFALLPYFMALRAAVRAHVTATQIEEAAEKSILLEASARSYFALADYLLRPGRPAFVAIGGLSGSGKSTVAELLAPAISSAPGARILESDRIRKAMFGVEPETRLDADAYRREVSDDVYARLAEEAAGIHRSGGAVVVDAVFDRPETRRQIADAIGAEHFFAVWLDLPAEKLRKRVAGRKKGASDADNAVLEAQIGHDTGPIDWLRLDADRPAADIVAEILARRPADGI